MKHGTWLRGMLMAGTVACVGCLTPIDQQPQASLDSAMHDELPSTLAGKKSEKSEKRESLLAKANEIENNEIVSSPLQKQLAQLRKEATEQRQELSQSQDKYEELQRRSQELRSTLQVTEAKIAKVEKVMQMIDDNPASLDSVPLKAGSTLAMAAGNSNSGSGFNLNDEEMPTLNDTPDTLGGNNAWGKSGAESSSLAPAVDEHPAPIAKKAGDVWNAPAASAPRPVKVILCDGEGATANYIISRPVGESMEKGMLFKADDDNILVVTDVYATNAKARLHPRYAKGGVKNDAVLTPITTLP